MGEEKIWFDGRVLVRRRTLCKPSFAVEAITSNGRNCVLLGKENGGNNSVLYFRCNFVIMLCCSFEKVIEMHQLQHFSSLVSFLY